MRPKTRRVSIERRTNLLHAVYGEIHGGLEYGQQTIYLKDSAREWAGSKWWRHVLNITELDGWAITKETVRLWDYERRVICTCNIREIKGGKTLHWVQADAQATIDIS